RRLPRPHYLCSWLRRRGFTPQKPRRVHRERDPAAIAAWLAGDRPRVRRRARRREAGLTFFDERGLLTAPLLRRDWAPRGQPPVIEQKASHREEVAAGLRLSPRQGRIGLPCRTLVNGFFDSEAVADFLRWLARQTRVPLTVVWDRGTMHSGEPVDDLGGAAGGGAPAGARAGIEPGGVPVALPEVRAAVQPRAAGRAAPRPGGRDRTEGHRRGPGPSQELLPLSDLPLPRTLLI
ncbi:MAG: winged helix-turn-helix domain-containing protein, partial [Gemmataceae bacterium]